MSKRAHSFNAFETTLDGDLVADPAQGNITVANVGSIHDDTYLVIDPEDSNLREYVKVINVNVGAKTFENCERGLEGSAGGVAVAHKAGATVRAVAVHQWLDDIFDDIERLDDWETKHDDRSNRHPRYLDKTGVGSAEALYVKLKTKAADGPQIMSGPINLVGYLDMGRPDGNPNKIVHVGRPDQDDDAATKAYVDEQDVSTIDVITKGFVEKDYYGQLVRDQGDAFLLKDVSVLVASDKGNISLANYLGVSQLSVTSDGDVVIRNQGGHEVFRWDQGIERFMFLKPIDGVLEAEGFSGHVGGNTTVRHSGGGVSPNNHRMILKTGGDIEFLSGSGSVSLKWDETQGRWISSKLLDMGNNRITGVMDPVVPDGAATKSYVDGVVSGSKGFLPLTGGDITGAVKKINETSWDVAGFKNISIEENPNPPTDGQKGDVVMNCGLNAANQGVWVNMRTGWMHIAKL